MNQAWSLLFLWGPFFGSSWRLSWQSQTFLGILNSKKFRPILGPKINTTELGSPRKNKKKQNTWEQLAAFGFWQSLQKYGETAIFSLLGPIELGAARVQFFRPGAFARFRALDGPRQAQEMWIRTNSREACSSTKGPDEAQNPGRGFCAGAQLHVTFLGRKRGFNSSPA